MGLKPWAKPSWLQDSSGAAMPYEQLLQLTGAGLTSLTDDPNNDRTIADLGGGGGGSLTVTDGTTTVDPTTAISLAGATVTDAGGGTADITMSAPALVSSINLQAAYGPWYALTAGLGTSLNFGGQAIPWVGANWNVSVPGTYVMGLGIKFGNINDAVTGLINVVSPYIQAYVFDLADLIAMVKGLNLSGGMNLNAVETITLTEQDIIDNAGGAFQAGGWTVNTHAGANLVSGVSMQAQMYPLLQQP